jgi:hypothetical protein
MQGVLGSEADTVRLTVVPIKESFDPWDPVILYIEAENLSDMPVSIDATHWWDIQVLQDDGEQVPWTRYGEKRKHPNFEGGMWAGFGAGSWIPVLLQPGEVESYMIQLDRRVDLSWPGTYSVRLRRWIVPGGTEEHPLGEAEIAFSDKVEFRIEETSWLEMRKFEISQDVMRENNLPADFGRRHPSDGPR